MSAEITFVSGDFDVVSVASAKLPFSSFHCNFDDTVLIWRSKLPAGVPWRVRENGQRGVRVHSGDAELHLIINFMRSAADHFFLHHAQRSSVELVDRSRNFRSKHELKSTRRRQLGASKLSSSPTSWSEVNGEYSHLQNSVTSLRRRKTSNEHDGSIWAIAQCTCLKTEHPGSGGLFLTDAYRFLVLIGSPSLRWSTRTQTRKQWVEGH